MYATANYAAHGQSPLMNAADKVFSVGDEYELATLSGETPKGYAASLDVVVSA